MDNQRLGLVMFLVFLSTIGLLILTYVGLFPFYFLQGLIFPLFVSVVFAFFPISMVAYFKDFPRMYLYAIFTGITIFFKLAFESISMIVALTLGGMMCLIGVIFLIKFIKKYTISEGISDGKKE